MIADNNSLKWLGAYLYYNEPWEEFLVKAVAPFIKTIKQAGIAQQFFFIRYQDRGPHIRLRFKAEVEVLENILKPKLEEHFNKYFEIKASDRTEPIYTDNISEDDKWLPNNSVYYFDYEPELNRYGGTEAMLIIESQFEASSQVVLANMIDKEEEWDYDNALGTAIKLHLSFVHALGFNLKTATQFFEFIFNNWLPSAVPSPSESSETINAFERAYQVQKQQLVPFHAALWEALDDGSSFEEPSLNQWILTNRSIGQDLLALQNKNALSRTEYKYQFSSSINVLTQQEKIAWQLYADCIHMTNNRLGIFNKDEGYLAYLIRQSMLAQV